LYCLKDKMSNSFSEKEGALSCKEREERKGTNDLGWVGNAGTLGRVLKTRQRCFIIRRRQAPGITMKSLPKKRGDEEELKSKKNREGGRLVRSLLKEVGEFETL